MILPHRAGNPRCATAARDAHVAGAAGESGREGGAAPLRPPRRHPLQHQRRALLPARRRVQVRADSVHLRALQCDGHTEPLAAQRVAHGGDSARRGTQRGRGGAAAWPSRERVHQRRGLAGEIGEKPRPRLRPLQQARAHARLHLVHVPLPCRLLRRLGTECRRAAAAVAGGRSAPPHTRGTQHAPGVRPHPLLTPFLLSPVPATAHLVDVVLRCGGRAVRGARAEVQQERAASCRGRAAARETIRQQPRGGSSMAGTATAVDTSP
eukprot:gene132-biopygen3055